MKLKDLSPIEQLVLLRHRKKWTQHQAARKLGVPVRTLQSWEEETRHPKSIVLKAIQAFVDEHSEQ